MKPSTKSLLISISANFISLAMCVGMLWGAWKATLWMGAGLPKIMNAHPYGTGVVIGVIVFVTLIYNARNSYNEVDAPKNTRIAKVAAEGWILFLGLFALVFAVNVPILIAACIILPPLHTLRYTMIFALAMSFAVLCAFRYMRVMWLWHKNTFPTSIFRDRINPFTRKKLAGEKLGKKNSS